jgi:hypothetical protein
MPTLQLQTPHYVSNLRKKIHHVLEAERLLLLPGMILPHT